MEPVITWILLADQKIAHIAENRGPGTGLVKLDNKTMCAQKELEYADQQGRGMNGVGTAQHKMDKHTEASHTEEAFAKRVVTDLEADMRLGKFHRLIVCAGPATLGLFRRYISNNLSSRIYYEMPKNLTKIPARDLNHHFKDVMNL